MGFLFIEIFIINRYCHNMKKNDNRIIKITKTTQISPDTEGTTENISTSVSSDFNVPYPCDDCVTFSCDDSSNTDDAPEPECDVEYTNGVRFDRVNSIIELKINDDSKEYITTDKNGISIKNVIEMLHWNYWDKFIISDKN